MNTDTHNIVSDAKARARALDITNSFIVQAPAGSGKTELLTQRILKLLSVSEQPENILAITFTKKAASEMRSRITDALENARKLREQFSVDAIEKHLETLASHEKQSVALSLAALEQDQNKNWNLLENTNRLQLKTIDSFCSSIVFQLPILSALGGQSNIEENAEELFDSASSAFLDSLEGEHPWSAALMRVLEYFGTRSEELKPFLVSLLHRRLQWANLVLDFRNNAQDNSHHVLKQHMETATRDILENHFENLENCPAYSLFPEIERLAHFAASNLEPDNKLFPLKDFSYKTSLQEDTLDKWIALTQLLFTTEGSVRKKVDKRCGFPADKASPFLENKKAMENLLASISEHDDFLELLKDTPQLPPLKISDDEISLTADICECLSALLAYLSLEFQARQSLDFSEIQLRAIHALSQEHHEDILLALDSQINHILIDEYQDTSQSQLTLLENLISEWQYQQNGKTLFLVGDPMQSIYRFREADVGIFIQAQEHGVQNIKLEKLTLSCNFRSNKNIVNWNNEHFLPSFPRHNDYQSGAVTYSPSQAFKSEDIPAGNIHCYVELADSENTEQLSKSLQCDAISKTILESREKQHIENPESFAILVRSKSHAIDLIKSFRAHEIPYQAIEIDPLNETPHILNLCNLCAALLNPGDKLAWFSLLRSALIGLENSNLLKIEHHCSQNQISISSLFINETPLPDFSTAINSRLADIQKQFSHAKEGLKNEALSTIIDKLWLSLGGPCTINENQEKDVRVFFSLLRRLESSHENLSSEKINEACKKLFAEQGSTDSNPVNIMSIHKAKGLEFDHVFIPSLDKRGRNDDKSLINWNIHKNKSGKPFLLLAPLQAKHARTDKPSLYKYLEFLSKQQERNENIRLLYVACTRPKKSLHLYGQIRKTKDKNGDELIAQPTSGSLFSMIWSSLKENEINFLLPETTTYKESGTSLQEKSYQLKRIRHDWKNITILNPQVEKPRNQLDQEKNHVNHIFSQKNILAVTGTISHIALQQLTLIDKKDKTAEELFKLMFESQQSFWKKLIQREGITEEDDNRSVLENSATILMNALSDTNNFWIFDNSLEDSQCEQSLFYKTDTQFANSPLERIVVDRSFIKDNNRWIIDYKTSSPSNQQSLDDFVKQECTQYRDQLESYGQAYRQMENLTQQLALYFPAIQTLHLVDRASKGI